MKFKKIICFIIMMIMLMSQSGLAIASGFDDEYTYITFNLIERGKGAVEDVRDEINKIVNDNNGTGRDINNHTNPDPTKDGAFDEFDIVDTVVDTVVDESVDWGKNARKDADEWAKNYGKQIPGLFRGDKDNSELNSLTPLRVDLSNATNFQMFNTGHFKYDNNIQTKKLPIEFEENIKAILMNQGFTEYWANRIIKQVEAEVEAVSRDSVREFDIGKYIVSLLPCSVLYGNLSEKINEGLTNNTLIDIDPYTDEISPLNDIENMSFTYVVNNNITNLNGNCRVIVTGITYGKRDDFTVTIKSGDKEFETEKKALNGKEIAYTAVIDSLDNLEISYNNIFDKPKHLDVPTEMAEYIQDKANALIKGRSPISNKAKEGIAKAIKQVLQDNVEANGDIGVIATRAIYRIPNYGKYIEGTLLLFDKKKNFEDIVRAAFNQAEVKSYASLKEGKIYILNEDEANEEFKSNTWVQISSKWYYIGSNGRKIKNGWAKDSRHQWYYLGSDGDMKTGWVHNSGKWYYLNSDGVMISNKWIKSNAKWYFLNANGDMAVNTITPDGYHVGADGACE